MIRLVHEGAASIRVEWDKSVFTFDPLVYSTPALLTWTEQERLAGIKQALSQNKSVEVVSSKAILDYLGVAGKKPPTTLLDFKIESLPYKPIPYVTPSEFLLKTQSAISSPLNAASRIKTRLKTPKTQPLAYKLTNGQETISHINCALHSYSDPAFVQDLALWTQGSKILICGLDYGHGKAFNKLIGFFDVDLIVLADLNGDVRRSLGMPIDVLSVVADQSPKTISVLATRCSLRID